MEESIEEKVSRLEQAVVMITKVLEQHTKINKKLISQMQSMVGSKDDNKTFL